MTIQGTLTTLECALDPAQYQLVRGVLAHNLGEALDELPPQPALNQREVSEGIRNLKSIDLSKDFWQIAITKQLAIDHVILTFL